MDDGSLGLHGYWSRKRSRLWSIARSISESDMQKFKPERKMSENGREMKIIRAEVGAGMSEDIRKISKINKNTPVESHWVEAPDFYMDLEKRRDQTAAMYRTKKVVLGRVE